MQKYFLLVFVLSMVVAGCMSEKNDPRVIAMLEEAKKKFAPDKRTAVFDVKGSLAGSKLTLTGEVMNADLKNRLVEFLRERETFEIIDSLIALPHESLGERIYGVVSVSVANIRSRPGHSEELATQAILGTPVKLLKRERGWCYVQTPDEYLGYSDDMIAEFDKEEYYEWSRAPKILISSTYTHAWSTPDKSGEVVSDLVAGNMLKLVGTAGAYYRVEYPNGKQGFVLRDDARPLEEWLQSAHDAPDNLIATAKRFMGVPYLWGGTSTKAMDCSGFTKTVFFLNGVLLPRDANQQAAVGEPVSLDEDFKHLRMGDLVFFGRKATSGKPERITHVGIYISNSQFIHESGDVRINSFNPADSNFSEYRTNTLVRATRVAGYGEERGIRRLASIPYYTGNEH